MDGEEALHYGSEPHPHGMVCRHGSEGLLHEAVPEEAIVHFHLLLLLLPLQTVGEVVLVGEVETSRVEELLQNPHVILQTQKK